MAADADTAEREMRQTTADLAAPRRPEPEIPEQTPTAESGDYDDPSDQVDDYNTAVDDEPDGTGPTKQLMSHARLAMAVGLVAVLVLAGLVGWLGFRSYRSHQAQQQRELFVRVGRQGALNLTTIDWQHSDTDVQRILDSATGNFYDDFSKRQKPFIELVKKAQAKSVGTITEAGLESQSGNSAQVLVAIKVDTSNVGAAQQEPRAWRMRILVQQVGDGAKISNVEFVP
jgi:Mce-associated membrane protein